LRAGWGLGRYVTQEHPANFIVRNLGIDPGRANGGDGIRHALGRLSLDLGELLREFSRLGRLPGRAVAKSVIG
jgi:hypothetical protein